MIKSVGIKDLKNKLSAYLKEIAQGTRILVTDRQTVIAEIRQPLTTTASEAGLSAQLREWIERGVCSLPKPPKDRGTISRTGLKSMEGTVQKLIDLDRGV